jgi:hypothetical protein
MKKGSHISEEHKRAVGLANKGKIVSLETRKKISRATMGEKHPMFGKHHSKETRKRMSLARKGRQVSVETRKKLSIAKLTNPHPLRGGHPSVEWREAMSRGQQARIRKMRASGEKHPNSGKKHSLESRAKMSIARTGEKNHAWRGGLSYAPYTSSWTPALRRFIRERDKYTCQRCGEEQGDIAHDVHHIDYDKKNCIHQNLITLCKRCHSKSNFGDRAKWITYFQEIMRNR